MMLLEKNKKRHRSYEQLSKVAHTKRTKYSVQNQELVSEMTRLQAKLLEIQKQGTETSKSFVYNQSKLNTVFNPELQMATTNHLIKNVKEERKLRLSINILKKDQSELLKKSLKEQQKLNLYEEKINLITKEKRALISQLHEKSSQEVIALKVGVKIEC